MNNQNQSNKHEHKNIVTGFSRVFFKMDHKTSIKTQEQNSSSFQKQTDPFYKEFHIYITYSHHVTPNSPFPNTLNVHFRLNGNFKKKSENKTKQSKNKMN